MASAADSLKEELFCTTNLDNETEDRAQKLLKDLGANYQQTLEDATTVLVVGRRWTAKYDFCVVETKRANDNNTAKKPLFITIDTLQEVRDAWFKNNDLNVMEELRKRRLDVFEKMIISFTNMPDKDRETLRIFVEERGGVLRRQLTRACTVLVSPVPTGKKVEGAKSWSIPVVHPKWVVDSLILGAAINPLLYSLDQAPELMGVTVPAAPDSNSVVVPAAAVQPTTLIPRKSMEWDSFALRKISATRQKSDGLELSPHHVEPRARKRQSSPSRVAKTRSRVSTESSVGMPPPSSRQTDPPTGIFANLTFRFHGFNDRELTILQRTVSSHSASVTAGSADYLVVNSKDPQKPSWADNYGDLRVITEWALERSLHHGKNLLSDIWGEPVYRQPTKGAQGLQIAVSGFLGIELRHIIALIRLCGATFTETLTAERHLLIAATRHAKKVPYAIEWNVPAVSPKWLWHSVLSGEIQTIEAEFAMDDRGRRPAPVAPPAPSFSPRQNVRESLLDTPPKLSPHRRESTKTAEPTKPAETGSPQPEWSEHQGTQVGYYDSDADDRAKILMAMGESPDPTAENVPEPPAKVRILRQRH